MQPLWQAELLESGHGMKNAVEKEKNTHIRVSMLTFSCEPLDPLCLICNYMLLLLSKSAIM